MTLPIRAILAFHSVARIGSMLHAAESMGVTPSAVSQQIKLLEEYLGTRLFNRVGRRLILTEGGERYLEMIGPQVERIAGATAHMRGISGRTTLNVRVAPTFATKWLLPRLSAFITRHEDVELRLNATNDPPDFEREHIDLEIRHGGGGWTGLYVRPIVEERFEPLCSPDLIAAGSIEPENLLDHRMICSVKNIVQWDAWFADVGAPFRPPKERLLFDRAHMSIDLAAEGQGVALESNLTAWKEIAEGRLIRPVRESRCVEAVSLWYVCPRAHLNRRRVADFIGWIDATLAEGA